MTAMALDTAVTAAMEEGNGCNEVKGVVDDGGSSGEDEGKGSGNGCGDVSGIGNDGTEGNVGGACRGEANNGSNCFSEGNNVDNNCSGGSGSGNNNGLDDNGSSYGDGADRGGGR